MTNVLIRKLIDHGYTPDKASDICRIYMQKFSLSKLESDIFQMEEGKNVDKIQSESDWQECRGLCSESSR